MNKAEIQKDLYKSNNGATFEYYSNGQLFYRIVVGNHVYQFPINTIERIDKKLFEISGDTIIESPTHFQLSNDLGETKFENTIPGKLLWRYISKAIDTNDFVILYAVNV